jgi:hypothetical protein
MSGNTGTSRPHMSRCPRRGLSCECFKCSPPVCLCALINACIDGTPEEVRIAFYAAVEAL